MKQNNIKNNMRIEEDIIKLCILYFELRNTFNLEFQKYSHFKNMIRYITNISEPPEIRRIFQKLVDRKFFIKRKRGKETSYHFNPYNKPIPKRDLTVRFD